MPFAGKVFLHVVKTGAADLANITEKTPITLWSLGLHKIQIEFNAIRKDSSWSVTFFASSGLPLKRSSRGLWLWDSKSWTKSMFSLPSRSQTLACFCPFLNRKFLFRIYDLAIENVSNVSAYRWASRELWSLHPIPQILQLNMPFPLMNLDVGVGVPSRCALRALWFWPSKSVLSLASLKALLACFWPLLKGKFLWKHNMYRVSQKINSQSLQDTQVGYISQKYTLHKYIGVV